MRLLILSDLHLEFAALHRRFNDINFDAVILAGDIHSPGEWAVRWAAKTFRSKPVVLVAGNHEYFDSRMDLVASQMHEAAIGTLVHFLDAGDVVWGSVRFLGCTLWTDFNLAVQQTNGERVADALAGQRAAQVSMPDYACIRVIDPMAAVGSRRATRGRLLKAADVMALHRAQSTWLRAKLDEVFDGSTVVVTHHAPHRCSLHRRYEGDLLSTAFVNELPSKYFEVPDLWVHGHTHDSFDYKIGKCRVLCNPRGYVVGRSRGNRRFNSGLVVELGR